MELGLPVIGVCRQPADGMHQVTNYLETPMAEVLIHLAEEPDRAKVNGFDESYTQQTAELVRHMCTRAEKVVYASSGLVYGDQGNTPFTTDMPVFGVDRYSRSKIQNELIVLDSAGTVLRLSNLYGRGMSPNNVLSDVVKQIPGTGPLYVRDDKAVRDFLWVGDAANAFILAAKTSCNGILNVGSGVGTSIGALARLALQLAHEGQRDVLATNSSPKGSFNVLGVAETRKRLGWSCASPIQSYLSDLFAGGATLAQS